MGRAVVTLTENTHLRISVRNGNYTDEVSLYGMLVCIGRTDWSFIFHKPPWKINNLPLIWLPKCVAACVYVPKIILLTRHNVMHYAIM